MVANRGEEAPKGLDENRCDVLYESNPSLRIPTDEEDIVNNNQRIRKLEEDIRQKPIRSANNILDIIKLINPDSHCASKAIHAARRSLVKLEKTQSGEKFASWLVARRADYTTALLHVLRSERHTQHHEAAVASAAILHTDVFRPLIVATLSDQPLTSTTLIYSCVKRFPDLSLLVLRMIVELRAEYKLPIRLRLLRACNGGYEAPVARTTVQPAAYKKALTDAWLTVLNDASLQEEDRLDLLTRLPVELLPHMHDPLRLADFLTSSYDTTENVAVSLAALDGLFTLISKHGLDYPHFYHKLYALLTHEAICELPSRHRFLQLTSMFLKHDARIPGRLVASFVKRLVRRAVTAPTSAALWCLRLALDLLYAHPNVSYLVHRTVNLFDDTSVGKKRKREQVGDAFNDHTKDPLCSRVEESSLWELDILKLHVSPAVSRLVTLFANDVRNRPPPLPGSLEDYAALSFTDVFHAEVKRKAKTMHLAYEPPGTDSQTMLMTEKLESAISWT